VSPPDPTKKLHALLKKLRAEYPDPQDPGSQSCPEGVDPLVWQFIFAFMTWEANTGKAASATRKLHAGVIDYNEMRVCLADELVSLIGERYPRAAERVQRLRSALNELYRREHTVCLHDVPAMPKRDGRAYLESLEGTPAFVAARMSLLCLGGHAFPLDDRLHLTLTEEEAVPEGTLEETACWLERAFHAGEITEPYLLLEAWMNDRPAPKAPKKPALVALAAGSGAKAPAAPAEQRGPKPMKADKPKPQPKKAGKS
jgi:hypothetical protein